MNFNLTDGVKHLILVNIVIFVGLPLLLGSPNELLITQLINENLVSFKDWGYYQFAGYYFSSPYFRPFQIVTNMFLHGDVSHIFFNMFMLFMFGPMVEHFWGTKRFLIFYFLCGIGAFLIYMGVKYFELTMGMVNPLEANIPVLGASGAIFGVLAAFALIFPNRKLMLLIPPIPIKAKYLIPGIAILEVFLGINSLNGYSDGIAHFAHVGGALIGFLIYMYWRKFGTRIN